MRALSIKEISLVTGGTDPTPATGTTSGGSTGTTAGATAGLTTSNSTGVNININTNGCNYTSVLGGLLYQNVSCPPPTQQQQAQPQQTQPAPTQPAPTQPAPTQPTQQNDAYYPDSSAYDQYA